MYVKSGAILPLLNVHEDGRCDSLTQCYYNSHTIEVYLSQQTESQPYAKGSWYTDDGISYFHEGTLFALKFHKDTLWLTRVKVGDEKRDRRISKVVIYGMDSEVKSVNGVTGGGEKRV